MARFRRLANVLEMSPKTINDRVVDGVVQVPVRQRPDPHRHPGAAAHVHPGAREPASRASTSSRSTCASTRRRRWPPRSSARSARSTGTQIKQRAFRGIAAGTDIGQTGLEAQYDKYLRGTDGQYRIDVNAAGERRNATVSKEPKQGETLHLSLKLELQQAGEKYLNEVGGGRPGAFVAMNPEDGTIYAMGSNPSYNPRDAAPGRYSTNAAYRAKFLDASDRPPAGQPRRSVRVSDRLHLQADLVAGRPELRRDDRRPRLRRHRLLPDRRARAATRPATPARRPTARST